jgi:threonylcarbamoyladenosine tRNA methylthiotransferase MtaB
MHRAAAVNSIGYRQMRRFSITTLGCKVNQYDAQCVADMLRRCGWEPADKAQKADLVLIQTCCVTTVAMRKSRQAIRRAIRKNTVDAPPAVCVLGCYGTYHERKLHELLKEAGLDPDRALLAPSDSDPAAVVRDITRQWGGKFPTPQDDAPLSPNLPDQPDHIKQRRRQAIDRTLPGTRGLEGIDRFAGHQRAFVKIQDGCDAFCSYCIVPYTRPHVWSRPIGEILDECRRLIDADHREIVLCGVFLGAFGRPSAIRRTWSNPAGSPLADLLREVAELPGLWRVRLSSLEPGDLTDDLLNALLHPAVAPHLHLPLQSGSSEILRRMNRQYTPQQFRRTADRLREALDRPALTSDIIVGFPGESDAHFQATLDIAAEAGFAKIHAFPFSAIKPTRAWQRRKQAPPAELVRERLEQLAELETALATRYREQFVGQTLPALVERTPPGQDRKAMTDRYLAATFKGPAELIGEVVDLRITAATDDGLAGELL